MGQWQGLLAAIRAIAYTLDLPAAIAEDNLYFLFNQASPSSMPWCLDR